MTRILFCASSWHTGLTSLCTKQAFAISTQCPGSIMCVTGEGEQSPGLTEVLKENGIPHTVIDGFDSRGHFGRSLRQFRAVARRFSPDVVHVQTNWQLAIAVLARLETERKYHVVYTVHGFRHNQPLKAIFARTAILALLSIGADRVIVPSSYVHRKFAVLGSKLWHSNLGVDDAFFQPLAPFEVTRGRKRLIFAGEFRPGKNQDVVIRALSHYCRQTGDYDVELELPGQGELLGNCKRMASDLGLEDKVNFSGLLDREQMLAAYQRSQCAIVPTNSETFGHCIAEPFVLGRIVISRPVGCATDIIVHGENGFLFQHESDLTDLLIKILGDLPRWSDVGRRAYEQRARFQWNTITSRYFEMLQAL